MLIHISQSTFRLSDFCYLQIDQLSLHQGEQWAFVGANGSGKSALARVLANDLRPLTGTLTHRFHRPIRLSMEQTQMWLDAERRATNSDLLHDAELDRGKTALQFLQDQHPNGAQCHHLARQLGIHALLARRFSALSTGEMHKILLCRTLLSAPDLLILDAPFNGLDVTSRAHLAQWLELLCQQGYTIVCIIDRFAEIPDFITHVGVLAECRLVAQGEREQVLRSALVHQLTHNKAVASVTLPVTDTSAVSPPNHLVPLIALQQGCVSWGDKTLIHDLNWCVMPGEHWQIVGPNGAGKSTLLQLVMGEHPQSYCNDLTLFGRRRGSGETLWQLRQYFGYVSHQLHHDYRVRVSVRNVILSGFHDTIGVYQQPSDQQQQLTAQWLDLLGFNQAVADSPFHYLSWGQQRLTLIVRALVKQPRLLILDEPLQGLDTLNRQRVKQFIDRLIMQANTQLLFVSHYVSDAPKCITHRLHFIPESARFRYRIEVVTP